MHLYYILSKIYVSYTYHDHIIGHWIPRNISNRYVLPTLFCSFFPGEAYFAPNQLEISIQAGLNTLLDKCFFKIIISAKSSKLPDINLQSISSVSAWNKI